MDRERQARWDMNHLRTASTKLTVAEHRLLREACAVEGVTVYALLRRLLMEWLKDREEERKRHAAEGWLYLTLKR